MMEASTARADFDAELLDAANAREAVHTAEVELSATELRQAQRQDHSLTPDDVGVVDARRHFLDRAAKYPRLTRAQEVELGRVVQAGIRAQKRLEKPDDYDEVELAIAKETVAEGKRARRHFSEGNLLLIVNIARGYENTPGGSKLGFDDLYQEGFLGLNHAITKFDPEKGYKFSTYATGWIRQFMQRAIQDKSRTVRLPVHMDIPLRKVSELDDMKATDREIMEKAGVTPAELIELRSVRQRCDRIDSLDKPVRPDSADSPTRVDFVIGSSDIDFDALEEGCILQDEPGDTDDEDTPLHLQHVDTSELSEFSLELLAFLEPMLTEADYKLLDKQIHGERLDDAGDRMRSRIRALFAHPAIRAEMKRFYGGVVELETDWRDSAACIGEAELYAKPHPQKSKEKVLQLCGGCAVRAQCREYFETKKPLRAQWIDGETYTKRAHQARKKKRQAATAKNSV